MLDRLHVSRRLFPAVYFVGERAAVAQQARSPNNATASAARAPSRSRAESLSTRA